MDKSCGRVCRPLGCRLCEESSEQENVDILFLRVVEELVEVFNAVLEDSVPAAFLSSRSSIILCFRLADQR